MPFKLKISEALYNQSTDNSSVTSNYYYSNYASNLYRHYGLSPNTSIFSGYGGYSGYGNSMYGNSMYGNSMYGNGYGYDPYGYNTYQNTASYGLPATNTDPFDSNGYGASATEDPSLWVKPEWATNKIYTNKADYQEALKQWALRNSDDYIYNDNNQSKGVKTSFKSEKDMMDVLDTDGDGAVSEEEAKRYQQALKDNGVKKVDIAGKEFNVVDSNSKKVKGTNGNDLIFAGENAEKVKGKGGDDIIFVFGDAKKVKGGKGNDSIKTFGNVGKIKGGKGKDFVAAYGDVNKIKGGKGDDLIKATGDVGKIKGNGGDDKIKATGAVDKIKGGYGEDTIFAPNARVVKEDPNKWWKTALKIGGAVVAVVALAALTIVTCGIGGGVALAVAGAAGSAAGALGVSTAAVCMGAMTAGSYMMKAGDTSKEDMMDKYRASGGTIDPYGMYYT